MRLITSPVLSRSDDIEICANLEFFLLKGTGSGGGQPRPGCVRAPWPGARAKKREGTERGLFSLLENFLPGVWGQWGLRTALKNWWDLVMLRWSEVIPLLLSGVLRKDRESPKLTSPQILIGSGFLFSANWG